MLEMTNSQAETQAGQCSNQPGDHSASPSPSNSDSSTPSIRVHQACDQLPTSSEFVPSTYRRQRDLDWKEIAAEASGLPNPILSCTQFRLNLHEIVAENFQDQGPHDPSKQLVTPAIQQSRHDSLFKPFDCLTYSYDPLDTTSGAENVNHARVLKGRRSLSHVHKIDDHSVPSPPDESTRGGAESSEQSESNTLLSAHASFDSNESTNERNRIIERPYTSSLDPLPRSDHGPSAAPSDVISDAGDQQELQLRQRQDFSLDPVVQQRHYDIEESLASLPASDFDDLQSRIHAACQPTRKEKAEFLPKGSLCALINPQTVTQELDQPLSDIHTPEEIARYAEKICSETNVERRGRLKIKSFRKIFALLVLVEATKSILQFLEDDVSDIDLPLTLVKHNGIYGLCRRNSNSQDAGIPLKCLRRPKWSTTKLRLFEYYQWKLLAPFFFQDNSGDVKHYKLSDHHILPFMALNDMAEEDAEREGGFGRVQMVGIHPDHHNFQNELSCGRGYAVKQQLYEEHRNSFKKEISILKLFSGVRSHPHVVSLLATFEQFKRFHLIFHRAEGDLFTYWKELKTTPKINQRNVLWMAEQCWGIIDGLLALHRLLTLPRSQGGAQDNPIRNATKPSELVELRSQKGKGVSFSNYFQERVRTDSLERPTSPINSFAQSRSLYEGRSVHVHESEREDESHAKKYGRHGDINPGNILWFDDGTQDGEYLTGTLKLTDFGQAELNSLLSRTKPRSVANTMTYRPPECDLQDRTIRQSYDIWCLGCVLLEFTAWMLGGKDLMKKFSFNRLEPDVLHLNQKTDTFFQVVINSLGIPTDIMVKKSVTDFIDELHRHALCSDYFHDLLNMIQLEMLVIDSRDRKSCEGIRKCLDDMRQNCIRDEDYAASSNPWRIGRESFPHSTAVDKLNMTEKALEKFMASRPQRYIKAVLRKDIGRVQQRTAQ